MGSIKLGYRVLLAAALVLTLAVGSLYGGAPLVIVATTLATVLVVAPLAARAGFRYGARRGVEAAIETIGQPTGSGYRRDVPMARSNGEPSADK